MKCEDANRKKVYCIITISLIVMSVALKIRKKYSIRTIINHIKDRKQG